MASPTRIRFRLGQIVATPGAVDLMHAYPADVTDALARHSRGDWGDVGPEDARENERSLAQGWRLLSAYTTRAGVKAWIITEADRSATTLLLPEEY